MFHVMVLCALMGAALAGEAPIVNADHQATWNGTGVDWESRILLEPVREPETTLRLAVPLPEDIVVLELGEVELLREHGRVVGLVVPDGVRTLRLSLRQPMAVDGGALLAPPLVLSGEVQRVGLHGLRFEPDPALGLEKRMRHVVVPELGPRERRHLDRALTGSAGVPSVYLVADERLIGAGGLVGEVRPVGHVASTVILAVGGVFVLVIVLGVAGNRLLEVQARKERLESYVRDEFVLQELAARSSPGGPPAGGVPAGAATVSRSPPDHPEI